MSLRTFARMCSLCHQITRARGSAAVQSQTQRQMLKPARLFSVSQDSSLDMEDYPAEVEVSYDEFKYVEQILPKSTVPEIPQHSSYPTPSGWVPPNDELRSQQSYLVRRTKNHVLPVYPASKEVWKQMKHHTVIKNIEGDIWMTTKTAVDRVDRTVKTTSLPDSDSVVHATATQSLPESREVQKKSTMEDSTSEKTKKLESDLCEHLKNITKADKMITQVHEVSRCIRIRGEHRADIAQFLLDKGM